MSRFPKIPLPVKLAVLPVWFFTSLITVAFSFWFYPATEVSTSASKMKNATISYQPAYNLFAALPKKGQVLGQGVEYGDLRVLKLREFFDFYRSPLVDEAETFIAAADEYGLPWTLMPAIACKESGCGRVIPYDSFNPFGWAVYTGQKSGTYFESWQAAIYTVAKGLRQNYFDQGLNTVELIETRYTPSSARSHGGWREAVQLLMQELENWEI